MLAVLLVSTSLMTMFLAPWPKTVEAPDSSSAPQSNQNLFIVVYYYIVVFCFRQPQKKSTTIWAVKMRRNMDSG